MKKRTVDVISSFLLLIAPLSMSSWFGCTPHVANGPTSREQVATGPTEVPSPSASPTSSATPSMDPPDRAQSNVYRLKPSFVGKVDLIIPVAGVGQNELRDTFSDARSDGRTHDAIDIPAAAGTAVLAAADGTIVKLFQSEPGGTTIYQLSPDQKLIFYYAHLQRYAEGIVEGKRVHQGEVIAYVGDTGNAGAGNYHLHFSIAIASDPNRYWEGTSINPYQLLKQR